jgi:hypothetical protein
VTMFKSIRLRATVAVCAILIVTVALAVIVMSASGPGTERASAATPFSALDRPSRGDTAASNPALQKLRAFNPKLELVGAVQVLANSSGTVWLTRSTVGDVCLIEQPIDDPHGVKARFGCRDAGVAASEGIVAGVPGHWYGVAPDSAPSVSARVDGNTVAVTVANNAFWLPKNASSVTVGGKTVELPFGE